VCTEAANRSVTVLTSDSYSLPYHSFRLNQGFRGASDIEKYDVISLTAQESTRDATARFSEACEEANQLDVAFSRH
jgi:hypothetical protein